MDEALRQAIKEIVREVLQEKHKLQVKAFHANARLPERKLESAGYDLYAPEPGIIPPRSHMTIPLGIGTCYDEQFVGLLRDRSSMGSQGQTILGGVMDANYRGEWSATVCNTTLQPFSYTPEKPLTQALFLKIGVMDPAWVDELPPSVRGAGAFGSTDRKVIEESISLAVKTQHKTE